MNNNHRDQDSHTTFHRPKEVKEDGRNSWAVVAHAFNPSPLEAEGGGSLECKDSLVYRVSPRRAKATQRNPASKNTKAKQNKTKQNKKRKAHISMVVSHSEEGIKQS